MKIESIEHHQRPHGDQIVIKDFSKKDYQMFLRLLRNLGLKRNHSAEKKIKYYQKKGLNLYLKEKHSSRYKRFLIIARGKLSKIFYSEYIERIYTNNNSELNFLYMPSKKFFAGTWKSSKFNINEFISLVSSNHAPTYLQEA